MLKVGRLIIGRWRREDCTMKYIANNCTNEYYCRQLHILQTIAQWRILWTTARLHIWEYCKQWRDCTIFRIAEPDAHIVEKQGLPLKAPWVTVDLGEILR